jgi:radical SAM protein with 4Fe4S-binding SPASM domain
MCAIHASPEKKVFPLPLFKEICADLAKIGCCYITLSGGEPLAIPEIAAYAQEASRRKIFCNLVTNGWLITAQKAKELGGAGLDTLSVSIDGFAATHDRIRGVPGAFARAVEAIESMRKYAPKVKLIANTVISPENIDEVLALCDFLRGKAVAVKFQPLYCHPQAAGEKGFSSAFSAGPAFIAKADKLVQGLLRRKNIASSRRFLRLIPGYFAGKAKDRAFNRPCLTPYYYCEFTEDGQVYPCIEGTGWYRGLKIGNHGFASLWQSPAYQRVSRELRSCRRCAQLLTICYAEPKLVLPLHHLFFP